MTNAYTNSYTQDLNSTRNTHLVAKSAQGAKYEAAVKLNSRIVIVGPLWLKECHQLHTWIDPPLAHHQKLTLAEDDTIKKRTATATVSKKADPDILIPSLKEQLEGGNNCTTAAPQISLLFMDCQFLLIGFQQEERNLLTRLVGRGCGTIYWELRDSITHVIVKDDCDAMLRCV
jgi:twin BRCT domain